MSSADWGLGGEGLVGLRLKLGGEVAVIHDDGGALGGGAAKEGVFHSERQTIRAGVDEGNLEGAQLGFGEAFVVALEFSV